MPFIRRTAIVLHKKTFQLYSISSFPSSSSWLHAITLQPITCIKHECFNWYIHKLHSLHTTTIYRIDIFCFNLIGECIWESCKWERKQIILSTNQYIIEVISVTLLNGFRWISKAKFSINSPHFFNL